MAFRVTEKFRFTLPQQRIERLRSRTARVNEQLATGLRINRPSDDPLGAFRTSGLTSEKRRIEQYDRNLAISDTVLMQADQALGDGLNTLYRIKELTIQSLSSALRAEDAASIANEIEHLRSHLLSLANTRAANRFLFSGFRQDVPPYDNNFQFQGDPGAVEVEIGDRNRAQITVNGGEAFGDGTPQTVDVFANVVALEGFIRAQDEPNTQNELERLEQSIEQLIDSRSNIGGLLQRIELGRSVNASRDNRVQTTLAEVRDADFAEAVSELQLTENALQATLASSSRLLSGSSLLDFLR